MGAGATFSVPTRSQVVVVGFLRLPRSPSMGTRDPEPSGVTLVFCLHPHRPLCRIHPCFSSCGNAHLLASCISVRTSRMVSFQADFLLFPFLPALCLCVSLSVVMGPPLFRGLLTLSPGGVLSLLMFLVLRTLPSSGPPASSPAGRPLGLLAPLGSSSVLQTRCV